LRNRLLAKWWEAESEGWVSVQKHTAVSKHTHEHVAPFCVPLSGSPERLSLTVKNKGIKVQPPRAERVREKRRGSEESEAKGENRLRQHLRRTR
jgi:hypothetical protein